MSDDFIVVKTEKGLKRVSLLKCDGRVIGEDRKEKFRYILQHSKQKADIVNKGIDEVYIEVRQNENRANGTPQSTEAHVGPVLINVGGKESLTPESA